jgi:hypothetical protein
VPAPEIGQNSCGRMHGPVYTKATISQIQSRIAVAEQASLRKPSSTRSRSTLVNFRNGILTKRARATSHLERALWGGPPGPRGTPRSRSVNFLIVSQKADQEVVLRGPWMISAKSTKR